MKSDRGGHRDAFLRDAPDLIIVDEAHIAARPRGTDGKTEHQRHELLRDLTKDTSRHIILVTATPHSGIEESFCSLLGILDPDLEQETDRKRLLPHVIQRRRQDVEKWLGSETPFPDRRSEERRYELAGDYLKLFNDVLEYCRETVEAGRQLRKFWSLISAVGEQRLQKWKHAEQCRHHENASIAILNVGRMNDGLEQETYCGLKFPRFPESD